MYLHGDVPVLNWILQDDDDYIGHAKHMRASAMPCWDFDFIYIVIDIPERASAMPSKKGNKQPKALLNVPEKDGRKVPVHSTKAATAVCQLSGIIASTVVST
jgi:hypothetical protein